MKEKKEKNKREARKEKRNKKGTKLGVKQNDASYVPTSNHLVRHIFGIAWRPQASAQLCNFFLYLLRTTSYGRQLMLSRLHRMTWKGQDNAPISALTNGMESISTVSTVLLTAVKIR